MCECVCVRCVWSAERAGQHIRPSLGLSTLLTRTATALVPTPQSPGASGGAGGGGRRGAGRGEPGTGAPALISAGAQRERRGPRDREREPSRSRRLWAGSPLRCVHLSLLLDGGHLGDAREVDERRIGARERESDSRKLVSVTRKEGNNPQHLKGLTQSCKRDSANALRWLRLILQKKGRRRP